MSTPTPWPYADAQAKLAELLEKAVNGEPQRITLPDGSVVMVLATRTGAIHPARQQSGK